MEQQQLLDGAHLERLDGTVVLEYQHLKPLELLAHGSMLIHVVFLYQPG
jgi:hypothetical protein